MEVHPSDFRPQGALDQQDARAVIVPVGMLQGSRQFAQVAAEQLLVFEGDYIFEYLYGLGVVLFQQPALLVVGGGVATDPEPVLLGGAPLLLLPLLLLSLGV